MKPRQIPRKSNPSLRFGLVATFVTLCLAVLLALGGYDSNAQGQVQVTAADPVSGEQGTVSLNVKVTGKGFKNGAQAKWFVTGTTNPGGVTVNSTTFVSSQELNANITVADDAVVANFDIQVQNSDGRGGKGTELFAVTPKGGGNMNCPTRAPAPTSDTKCYSALPGCLDATFSGLGFVNTDPDGVDTSVEAQDVAVQSDGKIVVAGTAHSSSTLKDFAVLRFNADGSLDTSFGDPDPLNPPFRRGYTITAISSGADWTRSIALQTDGKILILGIGAGSVVVRYNTDGTLDGSFGSGGIASLGGNAPAREIKLQADGKIVVGGTTGINFGVIRLNPNGSFDSSFGSGGMVTANPSGVKRGSGTAWSMVIQRVPVTTGEERIIVAGWSRISASDAGVWTLMRFRANGATDTSFGSSGIVKTTFLGFGGQARKVRIDTQNRIVVAGITYSANSDCGPYVNDFAVARYTENGNLDGSFSGGTQIVDVYGGSDNLFALALQTDGKVVVLGYSGDRTPPLMPHFSLVRFNIDGTRDSSFGLLGDGIVMTDLYGYGSYGFALTVQPSDGKIIAAGGAYVAPSSTNRGDIVVARYWP